MITDRLRSYAPRVQLLRRQLLIRNNYNIIPTSLCDKAKLNKTVKKHSWQRY